MSSQPAHLDPSELGTKQYWDNLYTIELSNHAADPSDTGTCWFDDSDAEARTLVFLSRLADDDAQGAAAAAPPALLRRRSASFLDLGCGNGSLLFALRDDGWQGAMLGVDYSAKSIALATQIAASRLQPQQPPPSSASSSFSSSSSAPPSTVAFRAWDLLSGPSPPSPHAPFDVVLDKGTFDAISLSAQRDCLGRRLCESYRGRLLPLLRPAGGLFLVTSCNWTEAELTAWFEGPELRPVASVEYPTFTFGGAKGQTISTLCFRRE